MIPKLSIHPTLSLHNKELLNTFINHRENLFNPYSTQRKTAFKQDSTTHAFGLKCRDMRVQILIWFHTIFALHKTPFSDF